MSESPPAAVENASPPGGLRAKTVRALRGAMEAVTLLLVFLSPWPFGSVHPPFEALLYAGVALLLALWGLRMLLEGRFTWGRCPIALCLAGLVLLGLFQLAPLPTEVLGWASPGAARLRAELLPARPEQLEGEPEPAPPPAAVSLYPAATRAETVRLLAVFLLFAVVRNNLVSAAALRRLAVTALADAALLAVFGVVQFFGSKGKLFWTFPMAGGGAFFGPFVCRNHFPFFTNLGVGLGLGILLAYWPTRRGRAEGPGGLLQRPALLWTVAALALAVSGGLFSISRGGFVALLAGCLCCLTASGWAARRSRAAGAVLIVGLLALGLLAVYGLPRVETRLASIWGADPAEEGRVTVWRNVLPGTVNFPLFGTGYGAFPLIEPLSRGSGDNPELEWDHAHNEYVEALVEGGLARLALTVLAVGLTFRLGLRALALHRGGPAAGLILGALAAWTTVVVHSFVDFGIHIPAVALLATVVAAQLAGLGGRADAPDADVLSLRLGGVAPVLGAAGAAALGLLLVGAGWRMDAADRAQRAVRRLSLAGSGEAWERRLGILESAVARAHDDAELHLAVADALLQTEDERTAEGNGGREHVAAALRHYREARDLCPLLPGPHVRLASLVEHFWRADPRRLYLERAKRLRPADAELWYLIGEQERRDGRPEDAWRSWRRSLELSERRLLDVVRRLAPLPDAATCLEQALPPRPDYLHQAALALPPAADAGRRRLLEQALAALPPPARRQPADWQLAAATHLELGRRPEALAAYQTAVARDPQQTEWRFQFARLLWQEGRPEEALRELKQVVREQPNNAEAVELYQKVFRRVAGEP